MRRRCAQGRSFGTRELVLANVQQHVAERSVYLARAEQVPDVVAASHHWPAQALQTVRSQRDPRDDRLHAPAERCLIVCLDDHVDGVALDGVVHQAEPFADTDRCEALAERRDDPGRAKRRQAFSNTDGNECRRWLVEARSSNVMNDAAPTRLASSTFARPAVAGPHSVVKEGQLPRCSCHWGHHS